MIGGYKVRKLWIWLPDVLAVLGAACIVTGAALLYPIAGVFAAGVALIAAAVVISKGGDVD